MTCVADARSSGVMGRSLHRIFYHFGGGAVHGMQGVETPLIVHELNQLLRLCFGVGLLLEI